MKLALIIIIVVLVLGVLLLYFLGGSLISEVTKEVIVEERGEAKIAGVGLEAPHFELYDLDGQKVKYSDFLGSPLILTFWASWNSLSADQIKIFDDFLSSGGSNLFQVLTVSSQEDKNTVGSFIKRGGYKVRVLLDASGEAGEKYQAHNLPATYFIDKEGVVREVFLGVLSQKMLVDKAEKILKLINL